MRMTLRTRLGAAFLAIGVGSVCAAGMLVDRSVRAAAHTQVRERLGYEVTMTGQMVASALFAPLSADDHSLDAPLSDLARAVSTHLSVLTPAGAVVADSEAEGARNDAREPEVVAALAEGRGAAVRGSAGSERLWVAEAISRDGAVLGIARASVPLSVVDAQAARVQKDVITAGLFALVLAALLGALFSLGISRPVRRLAAAARRIGEGDLHVPIHEPPGDEIGELGAALSEMARNLGASIGKLDARNRDMRRVLDTVHQGLVVVTCAGMLEPERSLRVDEWFARPAPGAPLWSLFGAAKEAARDGLELGFRQLGQGFLPVDVCLAQLPQRILAGERCFHLAYTPIYESADVCERVLVVISDTTQAMAAERRESAQRDLLALLQRSLRDQARVGEFLAEAAALVARIAPAADLTDAKRALHTLKGNCGVMELSGLAGLCHDLESEIEELGVLRREAREPLDARFAELRAGAERVCGPRAAVTLSEAELDGLVRRIVAGEPRSVIASQLVQLTRAPVAAALTELGERAAALAHKLGREQLAVHVNHDGTRLDRAHWAPFWSACVHAVRNAVDHGIELGDERRAKDKPAAGNLWLSAQHEEAGFVVELRDDGRGIDWAALAQKLRARGLRADTQAELEAALFVDGISTRSEVSETSGRGVGMGALRAAVEGLGGSVSVHSEPDLGTSMRFVFPHSVADTGVELRTVSLKARSGVSGSLTDMDLELDRSEAG